MLTVSALRLRLAFGGRDRYEQYPLQRPQIAERFRGAPRLNNHPDTNETLCIACDLCALACPENLIIVGSQRNEKTRRKELTEFTYDLSRCMCCGLCEDAARSTAGADAGFRDGQLQPRRAHLGPRDAGKRRSAPGIPAVSFPAPAEKRIGGLVACNHRPR